MAWIFTPITIPNGTTKSAPTQVDMKFLTGRVRSVAVWLPATTTDNQVGVRINTPAGQIFPVNAEGSDNWIYSYTTFFYQVFDTRINLGDVSPVYITVEGHNSDAGSKIAQVAIYVEPRESEVEDTLNRIYNLLEAMKQVDAMPDFEKQIRRLGAILLGGIKNE